MKMIVLSKFIKFTKASNKDKEITVSVAELAKNMTPGQSRYFRAACENYLNRFIIDVNGIPTLFLVSRKGKTLYSSNVHPKVNTPSVGNPSFHRVYRARIELG